MKTFETTLTGSDDNIDGIVSVLPESPYPETYQFNSIDDSLHLVIAKDIDGNWIRIGGSEPYLLGWVDELADKIGRSKQSA
ncbi:hypothetical protein KXQ82_18155 [Mucilaginibacter sp. HMF5004]|uniref:hypothetical protein n=1 Tax=Mucilaginibacter rivuli TaxID=2857527 RepID=UPI001C5E438C|nr:hypothetical protein [Mucilaginibacter rivuli]MBW4891655.1 hypothetical protein [Mucilaginibacter rivuli]